tara:strand:+ start:36052 stop:37329 length:1278 start_codon:yes stop_codon:yes gene_type:complete
MFMLLTDTIVLGRNEPGEVPYILISWFPISLVIGFTMGLLLGVSVLTAELSGRGQAARSGRVFRRGLLTALICGGGSAGILFLSADSVFRLLQFEGEFHAGVTDVARILSFALMAQLLNTATTFYLEALRKPVLVAVTMYIGVVVNLIFDLAFVGGYWGMPQMGASGVAIATTGTSVTLFFVFLTLAALHTPAFKSSGPSPAGEWVRQLRVGLGMAVSNLAEFGSFNFTHVMAGWISLAAATVYGMVFQVIAFVFMSFLGLGTATNVRVAERFGRGEEAGVVNASRLGVTTCVLVALTCGALLLILKTNIAAVFVQPDAIVEGEAIYPLLVEFIAFAGLILVFDGVQNVASMASRARGLSWTPASVHLGSYVLVMIPFAYILGLKLERGVQGMMEAVLMASVIASVAQIVILERVVPKSDAYKNG